ncbi:allophanate hydrolase subunit 2-domain-containing protein [Aspergillus stella-maris]|uniref:allophanate hydrolase subunit 2-domain-containing protein n=1 Tax=Aspergillus stella-maris TaxID=1810926 RepID=UPI003CCCCFE4
MDHLNTIVVANRGEIACRLIQAAKKLNIRTIAIYTTPDCESEQVRLADIAVLLKGEPRAAYIDGDQIIQIAKNHSAQAVIPGYGFLSENTLFARAAAAAGLIFVGPSPEAIESFGLKHTARELAVAAGVPVVPGTQGLLETEDAAVNAANELGYPVMLKATAGGGGMGLLTCANESQVRENFRTVQSRGASLFKNAGVFLERYYPDSHHIEVQVFGNGMGKAISIGERECSIQRRHQKVIEECPSPFVEWRYAGLREKLTKCAVSLAESVKYGSAGTVEYLVDDATGDFFFLEMNTRLQVEHGITEMCYGVDLVELMLRQADAELGGKGGIPSEELDELQTRCLQPKGHAIEARVYAENPGRNYAPSPGLLQQVEWHTPPGTRIDTWVRGGIVVSPEYDPLLAKVMYHGSTREAAVTGIEEVLKKSAICGPPVNLTFLAAIIQSETFRQGNTITKFLDTFKFTPAAIDVISGGSYTLVQDYPGRPTVGHGFGQAGPMDPIAFQVANLLVGNEVGAEGIEITLTGPELLFLGDAVIALCGPAIPAELDGVDMPQWSRIHVRAGQRLKIGKMAAHCRVYLAVYGGFFNVAKWFGSKSTNPMVGVGGYQGRPLRAGDMLSIAEASDLPPTTEVSIPNQLFPVYTSNWTIQVMPGPYETGYLSPCDIETFFSSTWTISHNAARGGIRLIGPRPEFGRTDGGEGGAHPSNVIEYGYPLGGLNWTGDEPVIFPVDCPDFGGFICSLTVVKADTWKVGQLRAGDKVKFHRVSLESALDSRRSHQQFLDQVAAAVNNGSWSGVSHFDSSTVGAEVTEQDQDVLRLLEATDERPQVSYRVGGDDYLLVDYGDGRSDVNYKCRATALSRALASQKGSVSSNLQQGGAIFNTVGCGNSLAIFYNGLALPQSDLLQALVEIEDTLGDMRAIKLPNHHFKLPITFRHKKLDDTIERYTSNQRSLASYLPDPLSYLAENNGMNIEELKKMFLSLETVIIGVGFFMALPQSLPTDPRYRIRTPKMNPSRTYTPAGTVGWGGSALCIYPIDCPGGYMPAGMTLPGLDIFGSKPGFSEQQPWIFNDMDTISFYEVSEDEYDRILAEFRAGKYEFDVKEGVFDMAAHNALLAQTSEEAAGLQAQRAISQTKMVGKEKQLLEKWLAEKQSSTTSTDEIRTLLEDPTIDAIEAPVNANVWKVHVKEGDVLQAGIVVSILEAMKMEINVVAEGNLAGGTVVKVLIKPGDAIESGKPVVLVKANSRP